MVHGGSPEWNETIADAVAPLSAEIPTAVAYGMADPRTLSAGLDSLRSAGVAKVAVVRLFLSGQSFLDQTNYYLGLSGPPPPSLVSEGQDAPAEPIPHGLSIATHERGLMTSIEARRIMVERALSESRMRSTESVVLLAHGMGDDEKNDRVLAAMKRIAEDLGRAGFAVVEVATLREDWDKKRAIAEKSVRQFVTEQTASGRRVIVLPMRLSGFGPYSEVLAGLDYTPGEGLLPHTQVADWIRNTASAVFCEQDWSSPINRCGESVAATR
jgi:sirohydrochlorin ferrochelatase